MPVRVGLLSTAHLHAAAYVRAVRALPNARLAGLWEETAVARLERASRFDTLAFDELDALLDVCDAVVVCAENVHHRTLVERAAAAGKAVLCEKPLATTPDDARAMVDACAAANVPLMTAFPCRFSPAFARLKQIVANGEIGTPLAVRGTNRGSCPGGWFIDPALSGGGAVMDHTVHVTDLLRDLLGSEAASVHCEADNRILHGGFEDTGFLALNFENRVFATLDASWSRPKTFTTWGDVTLAVTGTAGVVEMDMFGQTSLHYDDRAGRITEQGWGSDLDHAMVAAFLHSVESGAPVPVSGEDGLRTVEVVEAAYRSIATGQPAPVRRR